MTRPVQRLICAVAAVVAATAAVLAGPAQPAAHAAGAWHVVDSPSTLPDEHNRLHGVDCAGPADCWAVGFTTGCVEVGAGGYLPPGVAPFPAPTGVGVCNQHKSLVERWDGAQWRIVPSPSPSPKANQLLDVDCVGPDDCWAVGLYTGAGGAWTLIVHWDGTSWRQTPSPNPAAPLLDGLLYGVSCVSATDCWAVGHGSNYLTDDLIPVTNPLALHWDGAIWRVVETPNPNPDVSHHLADVTCLGAVDCWAVGHSFDAEGHYRTLAMAWDGDDWSVVDSPSPSPTPRRLAGDALHGVSCAGADDCWAVGQGTDGALTARWDGTAWRAAPIFGGGGLYDVTCLNAVDCRAVGGWWPLKGDQIATWNGERWASVPAPGTGDSLNGITCADGGHCWAVGQHRPGGPGPTANTFQTFIVRSVPPASTHLAFTENSATTGQHSDAARFAARLTGPDGAPVPGARVTFTLMGENFSQNLTAATGEDGVAAVTVTLTGKPGRYRLAARFPGGDAWAGSAAGAEVDVGHEETRLGLAAWGEDDDSRLVARLSDLDSSAGVGGRWVRFSSDGEPIGAVRTGGDGAAVLALPPGHRGANRTYLAVFSGDDFYHGSSAERPGRP